MSTATGQDSDCDGLIDNSGFADQTFDCWVVTGARYLSLYLDGQNTLHIIFVIPCQLIEWKGLMTK